jgi:hypothetical protein
LLTPVVQLNRSLSCFDQVVFHACQEALPARCEHLFPCDSHHERRVFPGRTIVWEGIWSAIKYMLMLLWADVAATALIASPFYFINRRPELPSSKGPAPWPQPEL